MRNRPVVAVAFLCFASCLALAQDLQLQALPPQGAVVGQDYSLPLTTTGGTTPYTWKIVSGDLPPGLKLRPHAGKILGVPTTAGTYRFTVVVTDSSVPTLQVRRNFSIQVIEGLTVDWKEMPKVQGAKISGSAVVTNQTGSDFDLTVLVVAVNEIGRATSLGYQHFKLAAGTSSQIIPFGSNPGEGTYYVRVDAVARRLGKKHIFRASRQTPSTMKVGDL